MADLLESDSLPVRFVYDLSAVLPLGDLSDRFSPIVVGCNEVFCATARRWAAGELPHTEIVVVGSRDAALHVRPGLDLLALPFQPDQLLSLVRRLKAHSETGGDAVRTKG